MRRALLCGLALAALAIPHSASGHFGGGGWRAKRIALERFPEHCAPYSIGYRQLPDSLGRVYPGTCRIWLDPSLANYRFAYRCTVLVHEFGHLAGYPDQQWPAVMRRDPPLFKPCLKTESKEASWPRS